MGFDDEIFEIMCKKHITLDHIQNLVNYIDEMEITMANDGKDVHIDYLKFIIMIGKYNDNAKHQQLRTIMFKFYNHYFFASSAPQSFPQMIEQLRKVFNSTAWMNAGKLLLKNDCLQWIGLLHNSNDCKCIINKHWMSDTHIKVAKEFNRFDK